VDPGAGLGIVARRKNTSPCWELTSHPACSLLTILIELLQFYINKKGMICVVPHQSSPGFLDFKC